MQKIQVEFFGVMQNTAGIQKVLYALSLGNFLKNPCNKSYSQNTATQIQIRNDVRRL